MKSPSAKPEGLFFTELVWVTHGILHRSATDIANSGILVKVGMAPTAHQTVAMFMRYVRTENDPVRRAAEVVANRRKTVIAECQAIGDGWRSGLI